MSRKDCWLGIFAGFLIGLLIMPVLKTAKADIYMQLRLVIIPFFLIGTPLGLVVARIISQKIHVIWQLAKFVVIGVLNVLVDFGTLAILIFLFRNYLAINSTDILFSFGAVITFYSLYKALSFTVANINSYFWNKYWTFEERGSGHSQFLQFFIVSLVGFVINVATASIVFKNISPAGNLNY